MEEELLNRNLNNYKKISATISVFILSLSFSLTSVSTPSAYAWSSAQATVSVFGGSTSDIGYSIAVDSSGNVYTTGNFNGTVDFDPGASTNNLTSAGGNDIFVSKLDSSGNFVWAKRLGGAAADEGNSIAVDSLGNVYTTGSFFGTADFDPAAETTNLISSPGIERNIFVSKLNSSGNFEWAKGFGATGFDVGRTIAVDSSGNVYTTGSFSGRVDFDPGTGEANLESSSAVVADIFALKLNSSGNYVWAKSLGGTGIDEGYSIAVDSSENVYTTGYFNDTADFDPGASTNNLTSAGVNDIFVSKLDSSGNFVWAKRLGGTAADVGRSIAVDSSGNVYTTGYFIGRADFDPGAGQANLTSASGSGGSDRDVFVSKLDSSGNFVWAKGLGGTAADESNSIAVDSSGNVYTTGFFNGIADFDPGAGEANLTSAGGNDIFVSKLNSSGNYVWAKRLGDTLSDTGRSIAVDSSGNVYTTGNFNGTVDFDPGTGEANLTSNGSNDVFVLKLTPSGESLGSSVPAAPTLNSITAGDRRVTVAFTAGANNGAAITDYEYSLNGGSYTSAGTTTSPFTITGLSGRTAYSVTIKAKNSNGLSTASSSLSATTTDSALDASEAAAAFESSRKAREQKELIEILAIIPKIAELTLSLGETTKSLYSTKCVKGKTIKNVKKGAKCPKGFVKR
jgi:alpha-tubulin suppressor-like RCC1 family protein